MQGTDWELIRIERCWVRKNMRKNMQGFLSMFGDASGLLQPLSNRNKRQARVTLLFIFTIVVGVCVSAIWIDTSVIGGSGSGSMVKEFKAVRSIDTPEQSTNAVRSIDATEQSAETVRSIDEAKQSTSIRNPLDCSAGNLTGTCPATSSLDGYDIATTTSSSSSSSRCPEYFRWIHEDLKPWKDTGITREMVEKARRTAKFRLVILNGKVYVEKYGDAIQTRDEITLWGILQLLRRYPGRLPDLDLMFDCDDRPRVEKRYFVGPNATVPPHPLFRYCGDHWTLDIVFPDWSFWGWHEINIKPWEAILEELKEGNERTKWVDREPYAYWKGNPFVAPTRQDLMNCNASDETQDWNARLYIQDWIAESQKGYKKSSLADQCIHRYKIYVEGYAWSVSEKYILACDSLTLMVRPRFYTFFSRGMLPMRHYWPIKDVDKCRSLKFAVEWGNNHTKEAEAIGKAASNFIQDEMKMDYVYDYMFHLLNEYAKLLRYRPTVPENAIELCSEKMACPATGREKMFMLESMVKFPAETSPCKMPPPFDSQELQAYYKEKYGAMNQVQRWEKRYWDSQHN